MAVSFAFLSRAHDGALVAAASRHAVRVVEALVRRWPADGSVDLYSVNVPLVAGVEAHRTLWTAVLQNVWKGGCFVEADDDDGDGDGDEEEERLREAKGGEVAAGVADAEPPAGALTHRHFKWAPRFSDVYQSVDDAPPGNDGWAVREGYTRYVTAAPALLLGWGESWADVCGQQRDTATRQLLACGYASARAGV